MIKMKLTLIFLLASGAFAGGSADAAGLNPAHAAFFSTVARFADDSDGKLWPGFKLLADPMLLYFEEDGQSLLFGHPNPPEGFAAVPGEAAAYYSADFPKPITVKFAVLYPVGGAPTNVFILPGGSVAAETLPFLAHEVFHTYQRRYFKTPQAQYCDVGEEPLALMLIENYIAAKMLLFPEKDSLVRDFVSLRSHKYDIAPDCKNEDLLDISEGTAKYVEMKSRGGYLAKPAAAGGSLSHIVDSGSAPDAVRHARAYNIGAALCFALDKQKPGWQKEVENGRGQWTQLLDMETARVSPAALYKKYDFDGFLRQARAQIKSSAFSQKTLLKEISSYSGYKVRFIPAAGQIPVSYTSARTRHAGGYTLFDLKTVLAATSCYRLEGINTRMLLGGNSGATFQIGETPPHIYTDGKPIEAGSGRVKEAGKTEISAKGFSLSVACAAEVRVSGREITVEVKRDVR